MPGRVKCLEGCKCEKHSRIVSQVCSTGCTCRRHSVATSEWRERNSQAHRGKWHGEQAVGSYVTSSGYRVLTGMQGHPIADSSSAVLEHRKILYDKIGSGAHPCHWCGELLSWGGCLGINADHLNGVKLDNRSENLVPSCVNCNKNRALAGNPLIWSSNGN